MKQSFLQATAGLGMCAVLAGCGSSGSDESSKSSVTTTKGVVQVDGYTDAVSTASYNQDLSERRARAVAVALQPMVSRSGVTLAAAGHGAKDPIAPNKKADGRDNPAGRASNRRVSVRFAKE